MLKKVLIVLLMWTGISAVFAQDKKNQWIDSVFQTLGEEEKIGQLFVIPVSSYDNDNEIENLLGRISRHHPGGVIITGGGPVGTAKLINELQKESDIPLLVMMDAENGPGNVLDSLIQFPKPLALGAISNDSLIFSLGEEIARQMKLIGANVNLAPNADIDIITRSPFGFYGNDRVIVSSKTVSLTKGLQQSGVLAIAKHTSLSDEDNNFINQQLDTLTFYPFDQLIKAGVKGMNTSHLHFSTLDKKKPIPASVSQLFVSDILKKQMNFNGLTLTEIPYIQSISGKSKNESERLAFEIGNDLLLNPSNLSDAIKRIQTSLKRNSALKLQLDNSVKRILAAKYDAGLAHREELNTDNLIERINTDKARTFNYDLTTSSITIARNQSELIPIINLDGKRFAALSIGQGDIDPFNTYLNNYTHFDLFKVLNLSEANQIEEQLNNYDVLVISLYALQPAEKNGWIEWMNKIAGKQKTIVTSFGNPYDLTGLKKPEALILSFTNASPAPQQTAQVIFGTQQAKGITPIAIDNLFNRGEGIPNKQLDRLGYGTPEQVGMNSQTLERIDAVVQQALDSAATPGCNIIVARNGKIVFNKSYGWKTYDSLEQTTPQTIYDLASITKVAATLQTVMFMHEKNIIDVNKKLSVYLPELKNTNKKDFIIKDILTHQAGLWPYLPYWLQTMEDSTLLPDYYSKVQNTEYPFPVAKDLFATKVMKDSLWQWIINAKIREKKPKTP